MQYFLEISLVITMIFQTGITRPPWHPPQGLLPRLGLPEHFRRPGEFPPQTPPPRADPRNFFEPPRLRGREEGKRRRREDHFCVYDSSKIPGHLICDGRFDCRDLSDEFLCPSSERLKIDKLYDVWNEIMQHINRSDVEGSGIEGSGIDEGTLSKIGRTPKLENAINFVQRTCIPGLNRTVPLETGKTINPCDFCSEGEILCSVDDSVKNETNTISEFQTCVTKSQVCDKSHQCRDGEDEKYCSLRGKRQETRRLNNFNIRKRVDNVKISCQTIKNALSVIDVTQEVFKEHGVDMHHGNFPMHIRPNAPRGGFPAYIPLFRSDLPVNYSYFLLSNISNTNDSRTLEVGQRCDHVIDCDSGYDELKCPGRFYCESGTPLYVNASEESDGVADCEDGSDEWWSRKKKKWTMASKDKMIKDWYILVVVWIVGTVAVLGNSVVIFSNFIALLKLHKMQPLRRLQIMATSLRQKIRRNNPNESERRSKYPSQKRGVCVGSTGWKRSVKIWNSGFVLNLALADFLMGIYLIVLGSISLAKSSDYWDFDKTWRSSGTCQALGVIVMISSQTSVYSLMGLTTLRLYTVARPFGAQVLQKVRYLVIACIMSWVLSLTVAVLPILPGVMYFFTTEAWVPFPHIKPPVINRSSASNLVIKLIDLSHNVSYDDVSQTASEGVLSWPSMLDLTRRAAPAYSHWKFFGFYSAHSVCIPKLYITVGDVAWQYTAAFLTINFISVVYICIAYICIYRLTTTSRLLVRAPSLTKFSTSSESTNGGSNSPPKQHLKLRRSTHIASRGEKSIPGGNSSNSTGYDRNSKIQLRIALLVATDCLCWIPICIMGFLHLAGYHIPRSAYTASAVGLLPINSALNPLLYSSIFYDFWKKMFNCSKYNLKSRIVDNTS